MIMIRCNYSSCTSECKYYAQCNLHEPASSPLINIQKEIGFNLNKLRSIDDSLKLFITTTRDIKQGKYPDNIKKPSDVYYGLQGSSLLEEKAELREIIKELRRREKNIEYICNRGKL